MMTVGPKRVKPHRVSRRPAAPFGAGLADDRIAVLEASLAAERREIMDDWHARSFGSREVTDADWERTDGAYLDRMAAEWEFERRHEAGMIADERCNLCELPAPEGLTNGVCERCATVLDRDGEIDPDNGGVCPGCGHVSDYRDADDLCPICAGAASDASFSGNRGY